MSDSPNNDHMVQPEDGGANGDRYTMAEAARVKGVSYHTVSRAVRSGKLPAQRLGRMALIAARDLDAWHPMRERAPHKYRRPQSQAGDPRGRPVLSDDDQRNRNAGRLVAASEQLLQVADGHQADDFGAWLAQWLAAMLRTDVTTVWRLDPSEDAIALLGACGMADTAALHTLSDSAANLLCQLAMRKSPHMLDHTTLRRLDGEAWLSPVDDRSALLIPLWVGNRLVGAILAVWNDPSFVLPEDEKAFVGRLAMHMASAIAHVELRRAHQNREQSAPAMLTDARRKVELLTALSTEIAQRDSLDDIFRIVAERACELLGADSGMVLTPTMNGQLRVRASYNTPSAMDGRVLERSRMPNAAQAMTQREIATVTNVQAGEMGQELLRDLDVEAVMLVPLVDGDEVPGLLTVQYADAGRLQTVDPGLARAIGRQCGHALHLHHVVNELEVSRRRLLTTLDQLPQIVVIVDEADGNIVSVNREARRLWGPEAGHEGHRATDIVMLDNAGTMIPPERHPFLQPLRTRQTGLGVPLMTHDATGKLVDVLANTAPVISPDGKLRGAVAVLQRREDFKPLDQARDEFISVVAHELRNPLTSLRGNLQLLERRLERVTDVDLDHEIERVAGVTEQVDRIGDLVGRMLDVSRADMGKLTVDVGDMDAVQLARRAIADIEGEMAGRAVTLEAPEAVMVTWDQVRVQQILINLLTNAVRYAGQGDIHVVIAQLANDRVAISVRDHGPGVPPRLRRRLFRLYYRFDEGEETADALATRQRGLGIGLYVSARLAKAHGGTLQVDEAEGGGAVFTLTLPRIATPN